MFSSQVVPSFISPNSSRWHVFYTFFSAASLLLASESGAILRQEWLNARSHATTRDSDAYPELWYSEQTLDHFSTTDQRTFKQRYFANFDSFQPGGPIIIAIGGEGPLSSGYVNGHLTNKLFAEKMGGGTVALEHRFYGKSQPFDDLGTDKLQYLTSRQALHDLAQFQKWLVASNSSFAGSKFLCM